MRTQDVKLSFDAGECLVAPRYPELYTELEKQENKAEKEVPEALD